MAQTDRCGLPWCHAYKTACQARFTGWEMSDAKYSVALWLAMLLAACSSSPETGKHVSEQTIVNKQTVSMLHVPQVPKVELGKLPPDGRMTRDNMPYFDIVTYCEMTTDKQEKSTRGPLYESCAEDQMHYHDIIGDTVDAGKTASAEVIRCAKATRTAYQGEWYCLNGQEF